MPEAADAKVYGFSLISFPTTTVDMKERFLDASEIPVSGSLRVGIMAGVGSAKVRPDRFHVLLPAGRRDPLCVEISSRDGRYEARRLRYELRGSTAGLTRLDLPSQHLSELAQCVD